MHMTIALLCCLSTSVPSLAEGLSGRERTVTLPADFEPRVQAIAEGEVARGPAPGVAVAVFDGDRVLAALGAGLADREAGTAVTPETVFPAASVSKLLTAVLVLRQVERGAFALDAPVKSYLEPRFRVRDAGGEQTLTTVRQLLTHTGGLPVAFQRASSWPDPGPAALEGYLGSGLVATHPPGTKIVYSNEGFALLGWLAAHAEGEAFDAHAQRVLLDPLGMQSSSFHPRDDLAPRRAVVYGGFTGGDQRGELPDLSALAPAGSLLTTVLDLARFGRMLLQGGELDGARIVSEDSLREMWRLQARGHPLLDEGFGLGFGVLERPGVTRVWWDGGLPGGATSRLALWPTHGIGIAILSNHSDPGVVTAISRRVFEGLAGAEPPGDVRPDVAALRSIEGEYRIQDLMDPELWYVAPFVTATLELGEGGLRLRLRGQARTMELIPIGSDRFRVREGILDGLTALVEGDRLFVGWTESRRLAWYETTAALLTYAGVLGFGALAGIAWLTIRGLRRLRRA
jgi:CubicO group peptidase (beta-lactamase class C family)